MPEKELLQKYNIQPPCVCISTLVDVDRSKKTESKLGPQTIHEHLAYIILELQTI
jgi:hypothetical protein